MLAHVMMHDCDEYEMRWDETRRVEWIGAVLVGGGARETDVRPRLKQAGTRRSGYETPFDSSVDSMVDQG